MPPDELIDARPPDVPPGEGAGAPGDPPPTVIGALDSHVLRHLPAAVVVIDAEGLVRYWNRRAEDLFGWRQDEVVGQPAGRFLAPDAADAEQVAQANCDLLERGSWEGELTARTKDGVPVPVVMSVETTTDPAGGDPVVVAVAVDDADRRRLRLALAHRALHDELTGLPNRALFLDRVEQALARQRRSGQSLAVLFVDLDRFKNVNDTHGHQAGDEVLRAVATRFSRLLRPQDTVARLSGDEFAVCCEAVEGPTEAVALAERLLAALGEPIVVDGHDLIVSPSIGIVVGHPTAPSTATALLRDADTAMYHAKARGRARWELFDQGMRDETLRRGALLEDLRRAVGAGELRLHFLPVVSVGDGQLTGFEALLRWEHPLRGLLGPAEFIDLAEETNLVVPIGEWVITEATRQLAAWRDAWPALRLTMAVNLSGRQIAATGLAGLVDRVLHEHGVDPEALCFEVTERAVMGDAAASAAVLRELHGVGVRLAIDDFGTGYSSLAYLRRFPVDFLKVDRSFVDGLGRDAEDTVIVNTVVDLAASLGLECIAEGVERPDQLAMLSDVACRLAQGFLWSRPVPAEQASALIAGWVATGSSGAPTTPPRAVPLSPAGLVAALSRDLAGPLGVVTGHLEALAELCADDPRAASRVAAVTRNAERIEERLLALVEAQQLDEGSLVLRPRLVDIADLIDEAVADVAPSAAGVPVEVDVPAGTKVLVDPERLRQVLVELVGNAVRYSPQGRPVRVWAEAPGAQVRIHVVDEGTGIRPEDVGDAFRMFTRLQPEGDGLGLGLFVARALARAHGGDLAYRDADGGGAELIVTLPAGRTPTGRRR